MDLSSPVSSVIPSSHGPVLEVLERANTPLSGRMVAALVGDRCGHRQVQETLTRLAASGLVLRQVMPSTHLYSLNRDHVAADGIAILASLRDRLIERMRAELESWRHPTDAAWLFGSFARGDGAADSDIDVLLLRSNEAEDNSSWIEQVDVFAAHVTGWTGNACNVIEFTDAEFESLVAAGERLPSELAKDGVRLFGRDIPRLLIAGATR